MLVLSPGAIGSEIAKAAAAWPPGTDPRADGLPGEPFEALQPYATPITAVERSTDTTLVMSVFRPLPRRVTQPISIVVLLAWVAVMAIVVNRSYLKASSVNLGADLASYGSSAEWR